MQPFIDKYNQNKSKFNKEKLTDIESILQIPNERLPLSPDPDNVFLKQSELIKIVENNTEEEWTIDNDKALFKTHFEIIKKFDTRAFIQAFLLLAGAQIEEERSENASSCSIGGVHFECIVAPNKLYETAVKKLYSRNLETLNENIKNKKVP